LWFLPSFQFNTELKNRSNPGISWLRSTVGDPPEGSERPYDRDQRDRVEKERERVEQRPLPDHIFAQKRSQLEQKQGKSFFNHR